MKVRRTYTTEEVHACMSVSYLREFPALALHIVCMRALRGWHVVVHFKAISHSYLQLGFLRIRILESSACATRSNQYPSIHYLWSIIPAAIPKSFCAGAVSSYLRAIFSLYKLQL